MHNTSFFILPSNDKMALQPRQAANGAIVGMGVQMIYDFLRDRMERATEEQVQHVAREIWDDLEVGGVNALEGIRATITQYLNDTGQRMTASTQQWLRGISRDAMSYGREVLRRIENEPGLDDPMNGRDAGGELDLPDLDSLLDSQSQTQVELDSQGNITAQRPVTRRPQLRGSDMEVDQEGRPEATQAARAGMTATNNQVSKETPISNYPSLNYGLPETQTVVLPWVGWVTMVLKKNRTVTSGVSNDKPAVLRINLNRPGFYIPGDLKTTTLNGGPFADLGIYNVPGRSDDASSLAGYPTKLATDGTGQVPQWLPWYGKQYEYYTVISTEYEVVMVNTSDDYGSAALIAKEFDSFSNTVGSGGNTIPDNSSLVEAMNYKGMQWMHIGSGRNITSDGRMQIIKGVHRPGQVKRNIVNDGDVKTWTKTIANTGLTEAPTLTEQLVIMGWQHPLMSFSNNNTQCINIQVKIKQIVQFKDLRANLRYPAESHEALTNIVLGATKSLTTDNIRMLPTLNA